MGPFLRWSKNFRLVRPFPSESWAFSMVQEFAPHKTLCCLTFLKWCCPGGQTERAENCEYGLELDMRSDEVVRHLGKHILLPMQGVVFDDDHKLGWFSKEDWEK